MSTPDKPKQRKPRQRRARGTGSIFFHEGRQRWVGRAVVGRSSTGKTLYRECWGKTQAEVVKKLADAKPPGPNTTVAEWAGRWLDGIDVRPRTRENYTRAVRDYITPDLGPARVSALTAGDVERAARRWSESLEPGSVKVFLTALSACLSSAVRSGLIPANPVSVARKPRAVKKKAIDPYTPAQLAAAVAAASGRPGANPVALLASTGCRIGEAVALDVTDFDPERGTVSITKTCVSEKDGIGPPKSSHSVRTIRVPDAALPVLRAEAGDRTSGPLFTTASGARPTTRLAAYHWKALARAAGLPVKNPHQLRHSVATAMIGAGVPIGDVAKYLGDTVDTIVKTYVHPSGADPAAAMDRLFAPCKVGEEWAAAGPAARIA